MRRDLLKLAQPTACGISLWCREGGRAPEQGFPPAASEGQGMTAAFFLEWLQRCEGGCADKGAQGCPSEQGPCTPGYARAGSAPEHCGENLWVEGTAPDRAQSFCFHESAAWVKAAHSPTSPSGHFQGDFSRSTSRQCLLESSGSRSFCFLLLAVWVGNGT